MAFEPVDLDHVALRVGDLDDALAFYHDVLGLSVRDRDAFERDEVPFVAVAAGGRHLHLVPTDEPFDVDGEHVCLLLRSDETDTREAMTTLLDELREAGVTVESGEPHERLGAYGRDWAAYVRDPDGRRVELKLH
ncbi:VOC family protein [Halococcus hamelinensis]|uniref:Ring-cleaving dioxygenase n=1 Tax=Halococcus hamelinensis 100A6 TaxID=1132509 RepID=M0LWH4_9EURY|nr:VOC family protein [Halococcus hamelinensis]EMA37927.1 ring-cleaving dioxygenase [Halococcus hamelinensis 100A6]